MGRELATGLRRRSRNSGSIEVATRRRRDARRYTAQPRRKLGAGARTGARRSQPAPISLLHARELRYRDFLTVALMVDRARPVPDNWIYIHDPDREGRPRAEFPLVVAGDGARPG